MDAEETASQTSSASGTYRRAKEAVRQIQAWVRGHDTRQKLREAGKRKLEQYRRHRKTSFSSCSELNFSKKVDSISSQTSASFIAETPRTPLSPPTPQMLRAMSSARAFMASDVSLEMSNLSLVSSEPTVERDPLVPILMKQLHKMMEEKNQLQRDNEELARENEQLQELVGFLSSPSAQLHQLDSDEEVEEDDLDSPDLEMHGSLEHYCSSGYDLELIRQGSLLEECEC